MKELLALLLAVCLILGMAACGNGTVQPTFTAAEPASETASEEPSQPEFASNETASGTGSILIAYFSWADNTVVTDAEAAVKSALDHYSSVGDRGNYTDVDAASSASVLAPGNTAQMAQWIQETVGGDLFPIVVSDSYPDNYDACMDRAADEKAENARPELKNHLANMEDYDVIFLGFPNWWYTAPMAIFSFLEEYDFSGKTVVPFCAHGTGGVAASVRDITAALPGSCRILETFDVYRADMSSARPKLEQWLQDLGFEKQEDTRMATGERKLILTVDGQALPVTLYDTPTANALYEMLPLTLTFSDFSGMEKISYPPEALPTAGEPDGCTPEVGSLCLYAPWGNLSVFYKDFRYSNGLILLGHVDAGVELLAGHQGDFTATLEAENAEK